MMSLEEAIKHCEEVAQGNEQMATYDLLCTEQQKNDCLECASEHRQLAEWLRELKAYREKTEHIISELEERARQLDVESEQEWVVGDENSRLDEVNEIIAFIKKTYEEVNNADSD